MVQKQNEIEMNGERFSFVEVHPSSMLTGQGALYFFYGIDWKMLDRRPTGFVLETVRLGDRKYNAQRIPVREVGNKDVCRYLYWNDNWYELYPTRA